MSKFFDKEECPKRPSFWMKRSVPNVQDVDEKDVLQPVDQLPKPETPAPADKGFCGDIR